MGFIINLVKRLVKLLLFFAIFVAIIVLIPNLPPYTKFTSIEVEPTQARVGPLAANKALNNVKKVYTDKLLGPETFQIYNGDVYTSLATGEIVKISPGGHVTFVTKIGQPCTGLTQEHICGRPLGFQIDEKNQMFVSDAYHGIWKVDLKTDKKQLLVSPAVFIGGRQPKLFNSLALHKNGDFYWTESSSDFQLKDGVYSLFTDPSGRLFHYSASKNESKLLLDDLWFPNGLVISPDNQFVVVAETCRYRLIKYYIDGPKKGKSEIFVVGLPGTPDNLRSLPDGSGVLVALYTVFDDEHPLLTRTMSETPHVRKFLARLLRLIEIPFEFLNNMYPHFVFEEAVYYIGHFKGISGMTPSLTGLVHVDWNGNIVSSYYNTDGTIDHISDAIVYNDKLYLGSPHLQNFIGSLPAPPMLKKAFEPAKKVESVTNKIETKPQQTKPVDAPKPKVAEKPKEEKKEVPKQSKPVTKPVQQRQPKPVEPVKIAKPNIEAPTEKKQNVDAGSAKPPKQTQSKPNTSKKPDPAKNKPSEPKKAEAKSTVPKAEIKTTPEVKVAAPKLETPPTTPKPEVKTSPPKTETKPKSEKTSSKRAPTQSENSKKVENKAQKQIKEDASKSAGSKPAPQQIPIEETIPSDTVKPTKETLKVIKKAGPTEIPNPNV